MKGVKRQTDIYELWACSSNYLSKSQYDRSIEHDTGIKCGVSVGRGWIYLKIRVCWIVMLCRWANGQIIQETFSWGFSSYIWRNATLRSIRQEPLRQWPSAKSQRTGIVRRNQNSHEYFWLLRYSLTVISLEIPRAGIMKLHCCSTKLLLWGYIVAVYNCFFCLTDLQKIAETKCRISLLPGQIGTNRTALR
jgi:hypothetical protein